MKNFTLKQHWTFSTVLMGIGVAISTIDVLSNPTTFKLWPFALAILFVAVGYIYQRKFFRCPFCGERLPSTMRFPERCEKCNQSLYEYSK